MSLLHPCLAVRNILRENLTSFYDNTDHATQTKRRAANCKYMPDARPAPSAGKEFVSVYCRDWTPLNPRDSYALEEEFTITVAVTHRTGEIPFDRIGEVAILRDEDIFVQQTYTIEARIREIVRLLHQDYVTYIAALNALLGTKQSAYDKLWFTGADPRPRIVGPDHFHGVSSDEAITGLLWEVHFGGSGFVHNMTTIDADG